MSTLANECDDEGVQARIVDLHVEDAASTSRDGHGLHTLGTASWFTQARLKMVPTTWNAVSNDGPAVTTQKRTNSAGRK